MFNSKKISKLVAGAAGLAAVLSSCGIQNQAGDSSSAPAGKIKNVALTSEWCYTTGATVDIGSSSRFGTIAWYAETSKQPASRNRYRWVSANEISDVYGPSIVRCISLTPKVVAPAGATSAEELPPAFVENSTANQCISVEDRKKTIRAYDEQIMAHSLDQDKTIYEQMKTSRWVTTVQRPCTETSAPSELSALACVSVSHKAFEIAFYNEQYELYKDEAGTPYLDLIIIGKDKANSLVTC
jgi:hypothetical protein